MVISKSIKRTLRKELWNREETGYKFTARIYLLNLQRWPTPGQDFCSLHGLKWWERDDAEAAFPGIFKLSGLPSLRERMQGTDHTVFLEYRGKHPWGNWVCLHLGSYNDWETKITETFALAPLILILGTDREMGQFFFFSAEVGHWYVRLSIYSVDQSDWRRVVLCCSCVMAWNIEVLHSCKNFKNTLIIHGRNRTTMIMRIRGHCQWQKTAKWDGVILGIDFFFLVHLCTCLIPSPTLSHLLV